MVEVREKQTDWSGTLGGLAGINESKNDENEIDENSPEYKKWREEGKSTIVPSGARIVKLEKSTSNYGETNSKRSKITMSTKTKKDDEIKENKNVDKQQISKGEMEIGE